MYTVGIMGVQLPFDSESNQREDQGGKDKLHLWHHPIVQSKLLFYFSLSIFIAASYEQSHYKLWDPLVHEFNIDQNMRESSTQQDLFSFQLKKRERNGTANSHMKRERAVGGRKVSQDLFCSTRRACREHVACFTRDTITLDPSFAFGTR